MPLRRSFAIANLNDLNDENQPEKINLPATDPSQDVREKERAISINNSLASYRPPFAVLMQPYTTTVHPSIFQSPVMTASLPRQSSLLGPCQHLLPVWPVFPPSIRKPDLYHQALKKSTRQAKRHSSHGKKELVKGPRGGPQAKHTVYEMK